MRMTSPHLWLPVEGFFFHRQQDPSSHTVLLFTGVRAGDLRSHLTREEQRNMVLRERAESFESHCSEHLQQVQGALLRCQSARCLLLGHKCTQNHCCLYSSIKRLLSPTFLKLLFLCLHVVSLSLRQKPPGLTTSSDVWRLRKCEASADVDKLC